MSRTLTVAVIGLAAGNLSARDYTIGIIVAVLILFFLIYTLLKPEKF